MGAGLSHRSQSESAQLTGLCVCVENLNTANMGIHRYGIQTNTVGKGALIPGHSCTTEHIQFINQLPLVGTSCPHYLRTYLHLHALTESDTCL